MKFLFIVQGEGRGHMTQAISFSQLIRSQGHEVCAVILGKSKRRAIPDFFKREINAPIHWIPSPNFETDGKNKKISLSKTLRKNFLKAPIFINSLREIHLINQRHQPDVILNFYDLLGGLYAEFFRPKAEFWVIGHQYLINHSNYLFPKKRKLDRLLYQFNTRLSAWTANKILALSFEPLEAKGKITVVPPLLRRELKYLNPHPGDFYLAYMVNPGYAEDLIAFAKSNPQIKIKAYWDKKGENEIFHPRPNLSLQQVNDQKFLEDMAACKGLVCTAGFESICEAMYLGKKIMVIPVEGQYEQACNAIEIQERKIGIAASEFNFKLLEKTGIKDKEAVKKYQSWVESWSEIIENLTLEKRSSQVIWPEGSFPNSNHAFG